LAAGLIAAALVMPRPVGAQGQPAGSKDPAVVLAAARQALGGEKKLSAVKSFSATGRTRQVRGDNLVPIEFEIFVELPDKYVRKDEIPAQESGPTSSGFNGDELVVEPAPPAAMPEPMKKARVGALKQDFARLALGMFAGSYPSYPLTFTYVGQAQAPQGTADVLDAKGPDGVTLRYFISADTHLPIMVSWQPPAAPMRPAGPGRGPAPAAPGAPAPPAPPAAPPGGAATPPGAMPPAVPPGAVPPSGVPPGAVPPRGAGPAAGAARPEFRVYFADYRDVDGMQFPFRIRRATGAETTEETTFDRFRINPKIDPKKFEVRK
jgi:hypothetical protein